MAEYRYPLDLMGNNPLNKVSQTRTLNMTSKMGDKFFIPTDAPFYADGCQVFKVGTASPLIRGIDYELIFSYPDLFEFTQKEIYGGVKFKNRNISGQVRIEMQILGGPFLQPVQNTLETVARNKTNVNTATWGEIAGVPAGFPVLNHPMLSDDFTGYGQINVTLQNIANLLASTGGGGGDPGSAMAALMAHINNPVGAHSKSAVGLGNVPNYAMATYTEADLGVNNKFTSPALVKYLIQKFSGQADIATLQTSVAALQRTTNNLTRDLQQTNIDVSNLDNRVTQLNNQFTAVRQEFANVLTYVNDLGASIDGINQTVDTIREQIRDALNRVSAMETTVTAIQNSQANIDTKITQLETDVASLSNRVNTLELSLAALGNRVNILETQLLYPQRRFVPAGTFHFAIPPGEKRRITLVGPGGGGGIVIPFGSEGISDPRGSYGTDTVLYLTTDVSNGAATAGDIILRAECGKGGQSSKSNAAGIEIYGKGGSGGQTMFDSFVSVTSNNIGGSGTDGASTGGISHPGAVGQTINGRVFATGGASNTGAGSGGAGAMIVGTISNDLEFNLYFTVVVGMPGKNATGNNFLPPNGGLALIEKI